MSLKIISKQQWLKKIHTVFFIKSIFYYLTYISLLFIWFYPLFSIICCISCFIITIQCCNVGDKYIDTYRKEYNINILRDSLK